MRIATFLSALLLLLVLAGCGDNSGGSVGAGDATRAAAIPSATALPPEPFIPFPARDTSGKTQTELCGVVQVIREWVRTGTGATAQTFDKVTLTPPRGKKLEIFADDPGSRAGVDWCYDLTGDGSPEISMYLYSGGAHCCITQSVFTLAKNEIVQLLEFQAGNAGALTPVELDGSAPRELTGADDRFQNFAGLPSASSPLIAIVLGRTGDTWRDVTLSYPDVIRGHRDRAISEIENVCGRDKDPGCYRGFGIGIYAESIRLRDWDTVKRTLPVPPETIVWLELQRPAIDAALAKVKFP